MNALQRTLHKADAIQQRHTPSAFVFALTKKFGDDNAGSLVVQVTYSMFVTIFPLLLLLITILGIVLAGDPSLRNRVLDSAFGQFPIIGDQLAHNIHAVRRDSTFGLVVGIVGLVYGSTGLAQSAMYAMAQIWNIPSTDRPGFLPRLARSVSFLGVLAVGLVVTTVLAGFGTFGHHNVALGVAGEVLAAAANVGLYLATFRVLTPKQITTRTLLPGTVVGGVAWTILQAVGGYVVGHQLKGSSAIYGMFGLVLGLIAWIYLAAEITIYAAELNTVLHHHLWPRSMVQPPLTEADQRSLALQATQNRRSLDQEIETRFVVRPMTEDEYLGEGGHQPRAEGIERRVPDEPTHP